MTKTTTPKAEKPAETTKKATSRTATDKPRTARSPLIQAIYDALQGGKWMARADLVAKVGHLISPAAAIAVYDFRIGKGKPAAKKVKVDKGRACQVMLSCITLVQHGKIEQKGRGAEKEYRLAK